MDVSPESVILAMEDNDVHRLIHGHTHRPAIHQHRLKHRVGIRYVLETGAPQQHFVNHRHKLRA